MRFFKQTICGMAIVFASIANSASAETYIGDWLYNDNPEGLEILSLTDGNDSFLLLRGTERYCGQPGAPYAIMRRILHENGTSGQRIKWWIDHSCYDGYARVCIENRWRETACSSYWVEGWFAR